MKYVIKYLPTEDNIVDGDKVLGPTRGIHDAQDDCSVRGCKKMKHFLCDKDIQVDDRITFSDEGKIKVGKLLKLKPSVRFPDRMQFLVEFDTEHEYEGEMIKDTEAFFADETYPLKIVAEVSPNAIGYVLDGDEFNGDEIELWAVLDRKGEYPDFAKFLLEPYLKNKKRKLFEGEFSHVEAKIIGPCGHFH